MRLPTFGSANLLERLLAPVGLSPDDGAAVSPEKASPRLLRSGDWRVYARPSTSAEPQSAHEIATFVDTTGGVYKAWYDPLSGVVSVPFSLEEAYRNYISETWTVESHRYRLSPRQLDLFYRTKRFVPRTVQLAARRLLVTRQGVPDFPAWPLDTSVSRLLRFYAWCVLAARGLSRLEFRWFWPQGKHASLILTHDVETEDGLRLAIKLADLEQEFGFRSSFNLGGWYRVDPGWIRELTDRGFEIGAHGIRHDRSLFVSRASFEAQQEPLRQLARRLGAEGFRSPATHRVFEWLAELPFTYDCSIPNSDPYEPQPGGCCSAWPFFVGQVVELPYTLPQDHTLFTLLGHRTPDVWIKQALKIESEYGLIHCVTHPDRGYLGDPNRRALYADFLTAMAERPNVWRALPREVATWWRRRDRGEDDSTAGIAERGTTPGDVVLEPLVLTRGAGSGT